jgi:hypothetical protein
MEEKQNGRNDLLLLRKNRHLIKILRKYIFSNFSAMSNNYACFELHTVQLILSASPLIYCVVLGRKPSSLGNGKLNTSKDTLASPTVPHCYMATKHGRLQQQEDQYFYWASQMLYRKDAT